MTFLFVIQFSSALILVVTILLHTAKSEGMGAIGGSARLFNTPKGLEAGLDRVTTIFAVLFLASSFLISILK